MSDIQDIVRANKLLEVYKELLTPAQKAIMSDYYAYNLSFAEIAKNRKITRAAVADSLKKSILKLENLEEVLKIIKNSDSVLNYLEQLEKLCKDPKVIELVNKIKGIV